MWHPLRVLVKKPISDFMWKIIPILLCLTTPALADTDPWGNIYPAQCADLSGISVQTIMVNNLPIAHDTASRCGVWLQRPGGNVIYILKTCSKPRAEVLSHELCHEAMWRETGDPRWHD